MPWKIVGNCVHKETADGEAGDLVACHDTHDQAVAQLRALYASEESEKSENTLPADDFALTDERKFPVIMPSDVKDSISAWDGYKGETSLGEFKRKLIALCERKGKEFTDELPASWKDEKATRTIIETLLVVGLKALYDTNQSDLVWVGVSHNAWQDRQDDIIPLRLIENDISVQKSLITKGKWDQFGYGLWVDHTQPGAGDCTMREVIVGGRSCLEMGNLKPEFKSMHNAQMSIGYYYGMKGEAYDWVLVYERSALKATKAVNGRTFFHVKRRAMVQDAAVKAIVDEFLGGLKDGS